MSDEVRVVPLGGLGEIGMNLMLIQQGKKGVIIDCGVNFADHNLPGIDLVLPDFSYLLDSDFDLQAIVLTHGHEDHIGAIPYLVRERSVPIYGSRFTLALANERLKEHDLENDVDLHLIAENERRKIGDFAMEFMTASHSIADALSMAIETDEGLILHTGDFRLDESPADGRSTDLNRFEALGNQGVFLLLSDSTNVMIPGSSRSETSVRAPLEKLIAETKGWAVVALFASHIPRLSQLTEIAKATHRRILVAGRSMVQNLEIVQKLKMIDAEPELFVSIEEALDLPRNRLMILSTGTQGERRSALARMAFGEHRDLALQEGDRVLMSSRFIPGNERNIYSMLNHLAKRGAEVITNSVDEIHVSGHARQEDLAKVLALVRPKYFIPIHGEYMHLHEHARLAIRSGVASERVLLLEDGQGVSFSKGAVKRLPELELRRSVVDGNELMDIGHSVLRERRHMSEGGLVVVVVVIDRHTGDLLEGPEIFSRGVVDEEYNEDRFEDAREVVIQTLQKASKEALTDDAVVEEKIRVAIRRFFRNEFHRKPIVIPVVMEV